MAIESGFQGRLREKIKALLPDCIVMKTDATNHQGIPDLCIMCRGRCAFIECKGSRTAAHRPNQDTWVDWLSSQGFFAAFAYPENANEILMDLQRYFGKDDYGASC